MLAKTNRLAKNKDFDKVFKNGRLIKEDFLILRFNSGGTKNSRVGMIVSRKVSKKATVRNKIKRRLRAASRPYLSRLKKNIDMIFIALPGMEKKDSQSIQVTVEKIFKKTKLLNV
jgi:ribonuclease P protein component